MSSLYTRIQNNLVRDYEVVRLLTDITLDEIASLVMGQLQNTMEKDSNGYTDMQINICTGEIIRTLIAIGVKEYESNLD